MSPMLIVLIVAVLLVAIVIFIFNRFVGNRNLVKDAWSNIDVALKRRHDLVPNLVNTVKGYAAHEAGTLEKVIEARNAAATVAPDDINGRIQAENNLQSGLRSLFALAERYPDLKANTNYLDLQQKLSELEEGLERSRRYYNATVRQNNSFGESFPGILFAGSFGYKHFNYFEITGDERAVPKSGILMKTSWLFIRFWLIGIAFSLLGIQNLHAQDKTLEIKDLLVEIELLKKGEIRVREIYEVNFLTPHRGIWRAIPGNFHYTHPDGRVQKSRLDIGDIKVPGWEYDVKRESGNTGVRIGEEGKFIEGLHKYEIRYTVSGAVIRESTQDIFYWNLLGNEWDIPVHKVHFSIQLPDNIALQQNQYAAYNGRGGDTTHANFSYANGLFEGASNTVLGNGKQMTALLKFPQNYFTLPSAAQKNFRDYGAFLWFLPILIGFYFLWNKHGKNEKLPIAVEYFPPEGIDPVQAGYLMDGRTDTRDITCMIPYWGANGYLSMHEEKDPGLFKKKKIILKKLKDLPKGKMPYEYTMFYGLFKDGDEVELDALKNKFYKTMEEVKGKLDKEISAGGYYERESKKLGVGLFFGFIVLAGAAFLIFRGEPLQITIWMLVCALLAFAAIFLLRKRTPKGNETRRQILGFRMFMDKAEKNQLRTLLQEEPGYFEKTLPYAVAFGLVKKWAGKFDGLDLQPPGWYHSNMYNSSYNYSPAGFASAFQQSLGSLSTTMVSSPGGSSGSAGGSSGGGAGGGGGGGW